LVFVPFDHSEEDDPASGGQPLPPDDRLWRHPSELGAIQRGAGDEPKTATDTRSGAGSKTWAVAVVAALIGSALSLGAVAALGRLSNDVVEKPVTERVAVRPAADLNASGSSGPSVMAISNSVSPSIARVEATVDGAPVEGSAIVIRDDGYLVTTSQLVAGQTQVQVVLADGTALPGQVVGSDAMTNVAVVKVDRDHLQTALLGTAVELAPGEATIAIASPLGPSAGPTVTVALVGAVGQLVIGRDGNPLYDLIQIDSPIAGDGSGGALCDSSGSLIGMTTAVADDPAHNGVGYAIPVDIMRAIADDIITTGAARHPWLGIEGDDLDPTEAKTMGLDGGAKVTKVVDGSPAAAAGVHPDDVITALDGKAVSSMSAFVVGLRGHHPGDAINVNIQRGADTAPLNMTITLGERNAS
jgi:S1-C subfamily serine protease